MSWFRTKRKLPRISGEDLATTRWLRVYFRYVLASTDAVLFLASGLAVGLLANHFSSIEVGGVTELFALAAIGFAGLAVALTALSIFVSLVDDAYLRILDLSQKGGLPGYLVPFIAAALVSSVATIFGIVGAVIYPALPEWFKATVLGLEAGLVVWAAWAVFQIVVEVAMHGVGRYDIASAFEKARKSEIDQVIEEHGAPTDEDRPHTYKGDTPT